MCRANYSFFALNFAHYHYGSLLLHSTCLFVLRTRMSAPISPDHLTSRNLSKEAHWMPLLNLLYLLIVRELKAEEEEEEDFAVLI